jgi:hypothetical protein
LATSHQKNKAQFKKLASKAKQPNNIVVKEATAKQAPSQTTTVLSAEKSLSPDINEKAKIETNCSTKPAEVKTDAAKDMQESSEKTATNWHIMPALPKHSD